MTRHTKTVAALFLLVMVFLSSCATTSHYQLGHQALEEERYNDAIRNLKLAIIDNIYDVEAIRDFGIAIYYKKKLNLAERFLKLALMRRPNDPVIYYYLGLLYEETGQYDKAIQMYSKYVDVSPFNEFRDKIEGRLYVLSNRQIKHQVDLLLSQERALDVISSPNNAVAVAGFQNLTGEPKLDLLQKGLVDMLITDLSQVRIMNVVERARLQHIMKELALGQTGLLAEENLPRLGQLLGASHIIAGTLVGLGGQDLQINSSISHLKYGIKSNPQKIIGSLQDFIKLEKDLVFEIIDKFGIKLSLEERLAIQEVPTTDMTAFWAYCRGLDLEEKGMYPQAAQQFQRAAQIDPNFTRAQSAAIKMDAMRDFSPSPPKPKQSQILAKGGSRHRDRASRTKAESHYKTQLLRSDPKLKDKLADRLQRTANHVTPGFVPSIESRKPTSESDSPSFGTSAPIKVRIQIPTKP